MCFSSLSSFSSCSFVQFSSLSTLAFNSSFTLQNCSSIEAQDKQVYSFAFLVTKIVSDFVFVQCKCVRSFQYVHIIRFNFMHTVFSHTEQIGALRFVVPFFTVFVYHLLVLILSWLLTLTLDSLQYLLLAISVELLMYLNNKRQEMIFSAFFQIHVDVTDTSFQSTVALMEIALRRAFEVFLTR